MRVHEPGHVYELEQLDYPVWSVSTELEAKRHQCPEGAPLMLRFVARETGRRHCGTQTQDVLRALIDRTQHCDACLRWEGNDLIIYHLRMALVLHEARALARKVEKGIIRPEVLATAHDGHFLLTPRDVFRTGDGGEGHERPCA